jgi:hypothetical protein
MAKFGVDPHGRWDKNLAQEQFKGHVENIIQKYHSASPEFLKGGNEWYERAHDVAKGIGGGDVQRGAGIVAALSPQMSWERNINMAHELVRHGTASHTEDNLKKALKIHEGADPREVLGGHKVRSFYENIVDPSNPNPVTIDRHAHDIAVGDPFKGSGGGTRNTAPVDLGLSSMGRYKHFEHAYRHAAGELGVELPHKVQAVTWVTHRGAIG